MVPPDRSNEFLSGIVRCSISDGTKRATSVNVPLLLLQSSEGKLRMSREIEVGNFASQDSDVCSAQLWRGVVDMENMHSSSYGQLSTTQHREFREPGF